MIMDSNILVIAVTAGLITVISWFILVVDVRKIRKEICGFNLKKKAWIEFQKGNMDKAYDCLFEAFIADLFRHDLDVDYVIETYTTLFKQIGKGIPDLEHISKQKCWGTD
jgi:hypothetical protein